MAQAWAAARVKATPAVIAAQIRPALQPGGSAQHAQAVQRFFPEGIRSRGWYTADLRRAALGFRRQIQKEHGLDFLVKVADQLFLGWALEEEIAAIFLLEKLDAEFGDSEYKLFASWLGRISNWADHDGLVHYCIAPMVARKPARLKTVFCWAKSADRWHRWAACVALIRGAREKMFFREIIKPADLLLADEDDMVQKGRGWLLRETAKHDAKRTVAYWMKIRGRASRLVWRTACETLPATMRKQVLLCQQSSAKTKLFECNPSSDSLNSRSLFTIVVCPWTYPPFKLRYAKATSTPGSFTTIIIAIPLPTGCSACRLD